MDAKHEVTPEEWIQAHKNERSNTHNEHVYLVDFMCDVDIEDDGTYMGADTEYSRLMAELNRKACKFLEGEVKKHNAKFALKKEEALEDVEKRKRTKSEI